MQKLGDIALIATQFSEQRRFFRVAISNLKIAIRTRAGVAGVVCNIKIEEVQNYEGPIILQVKYFEYLSRNVKIKGQPEI